MEAILEKIIEAIPYIFQALGAIVIAATAIVRLTPKPKDDEVIDSIGSKVFKVISYLPTIGVNPKTKDLEAAYKKLKEEQVDKILEDAKGN